MRTITLTLSILLGLVAFFVDAKLPQPLDGFSKNNPGAIFTMTQAGVDHMIEVTQNVWNRVAKNLRLEKTTIELTTPIVATIILKKLRTVDYEGPSFSGEIQSNGLRIKSANFKQLSSVANLDFNIPQFDIDVVGPVTADLSDIFIDLDVRIGTNPQTMAPNVKIPNCQFDIGSMVLGTDKLTGSGSKYLKDDRLKKTITEYTKQFFGIEFCKKVKGGIIDQLNNQLATLVTKKNIKSSRRQNPYTDFNFRVLERHGIPGTQLDSMSHFDASQFLVDNTYFNTDQPSFHPGPGYIRSLHNSLIKLQNSGDIPFNPPPIGKLRDASMRKHLYAQLSDFTVNSMLYSAHKNNLLDTKLVGAGGVSVSQEPRGVSDAASPYVTIKRNRTNLYCEGRVETTKFGSTKSTIATNSVAEADIKLSSTGSTVKADAVIRKFHITGGEISELTAADNRDLTSITKTMLEKLTDDVLARTVAVPDSKYGYAKDLSFSLRQDRVLEVGLNLELNEDELVAELHRYIKENFS